MHQVVVRDPGGQPRCRRRPPRPHLRRPGRARMEVQPWLPAVPVAWDLRGHRAAGRSPLSSCGTLSGGPCRCSRASARRRTDGTRRRNALGGTPWTRDPAEARAGGSPSTRGVVRWRVVRRLRSILPTSADGRTPASPPTGRDGGPCSLPSRRSRPRSPDAASPTAWRRNASTACRAPPPIHVPGYGVRRGRSSARTATLALLSRSQRAVDPRARAITAAVAARNPTAMSSCEAMACPPPVQPHGCPVPGRPWRPTRRSRR